MGALSTAALTPLALLMLGVGLVFSSGDAIAQKASLAQLVAGTWTYVAVDIIHSDGTRTPLFGPDPEGIAIFDGHGHYALMTSRSGLPKFASNNRNDGTPEENKAVVQGSIAHFGTYTVDEADKSITFHIQASTFPNWNGIAQKRPVTVTSSELKWKTAASSGGTAEVVLKRAQ